MSAELEGTLSTRDTLEGEISIGNGTKNYPDLDNKPQINGVELVGNKTTEDLGIEVPAKTSDLENDSGFITAEDVPTKTSDLENDSGFVTAEDIPTKTSDLQNDSGFITDSDLPTKVSDLENDTGFITSEDLPTKVSDLENDSGFITSEDVPTKTSELDNDSGYVTISDVINDITSSDNQAYSSDKVEELIDSLLPVDTSSGVIASFSTDLAKPLVSLKANVDAVQDLHGQSGAYISGGQLWDETWELGAWSSVNGGAVNYTDRIRCKNLIPVQSSTAYNIRLGTTASCVVNAHDVNGDFIENIVTGTFGTGGRAFTTPSTCKYIKFSVGIAYGTTYKNDISVNYPSTDTAYHPYTNICPIYGLDSVKIGYVNFNQLINVNAVTTIRNGITYTNNNDGSWTLTGTPDSSNAFLNLDYVVGRTYLYSNHVYFLPKCNNSSLKIGLGLFGGAVDTYSIDGDKIVKFDSVSSENNWTRIQITNADGVNIGTVTLKPQLYDITQMFGSYIADYLYSLPDKGLSIIKQLLTKDYYPYNAGGTWVTLDSVNGEPTCLNVLIPFNDTIYGGYVTQDNNGLKLVVTHETFTFSGSENWTAYGTFFYLPAGTITETPIQENAIATNGFTINPLTNGQIRVYPSYGINSQYISMESTSEDLNGYLSNGIRFLYRLATPIEIPLSDIPEIVTLIGTNNIFADSGDVEVKYKESIQKYIDDKIAETQALIL